MSPHLGITLHSAVLKHIQLAHDCKLTRGQAMHIHTTHMAEVQLKPVDLKHGVGYKQHGRLYFRRTARTS